MLSGSLTDCDIHILKSDVVSQTDSLDSDGNLNLVKTSNKMSLLRKSNISINKSQGLSSNYSSP